MAVAIRVDGEGEHLSLVPIGPFDLAHAAAVARAVETAEPHLSCCASVAIDLGQLDRIDGAGAVWLARLLDRLDDAGRQTCVVEGDRPEAARLIALYRHRREDRPTAVGTLQESSGADR